MIYSVKICKPGDTIFDGAENEEVFGYNIERNNPKRTSEVGSWSQEIEKCRKIGKFQIDIDTKTVRDVLAKFAPPNAEMNRRQYDASNLKGTLNNCTVFQDWVRYKNPNTAPANDYFDQGWLQKFQEVAKMRNDHIGHCNSQRLRIELNVYLARQNISLYTDN